MSDQDRPDKPKGPSHIAYQVSDGQDGKSYFNRVGAAFEHKDHKGFNVVLDSVPVDGRVTLRTPQERIEAMRSEPQPQQQPPQQVQEQAPSQPEVQTTVPEPARQAEPQQQPAPQQVTQGHER